MNLPQLDQNLSLIFMRYEIDQINYDDTIIINSLLMYSSAIQSVQQSERAQYYKSGMYELVVIHSEFSILYIRSFKYAQRAYGNSAMSLLVSLQKPYIED